MHPTSGIQQVPGGWTGHGKVYPYEFRSQKIPGGAGTCRSPLEERLFRALARNPAVLSFAVRPMRIAFHVGPKTHHFTPDVLVQYADGRKVLVVVKPGQTVPDPAEQAMFKAAADYAAAHGMAFEVWTGPRWVSATDPRGGNGDFDIATAARLQTEAAAADQPHRREPAKGTLTFWTVIVVVVVLVMLMRLAH